jgi:DNA-binding IscR family transcriptional regulator
MAYGIGFTQAVFVLVYLCDKTTLGRQDLISTPSISEALSIPKPSVVKILKALNLAGITGSGIGKNGGCQRPQGSGRDPFSGCVLGD